MRTDQEYDRFPIAKRGYDPHAVEAFLDLSSTDSERMLNEAAARIAALEVELEEAHKQEEAVHLTILAATKAKEDMLVAARHQADKLAAKARKDGDRLITDARMQAFKLVTGAREEAETIVGEARSEAAAIARVNDTSTDEVTGPSDDEVALQERIETMQNVIEAMELALASRPTTADPQVTDDESPMETEVPGVELVEAAAVEATAHDKAAAPPTSESEPISDDIEVIVADGVSAEASDESDAVAFDEPVITIEPATDESVAASASESKTADEQDEDRAAEAIRRSFYSRRSANLPQIGAEAGRDAMAAVAGLRTNFVAAEASDDGDTEPTPAFEAV